MKPLKLALATAMAVQLGASAAYAASAEMKSPDGSAMGTVTLEQTPQGVLLKADLSGLPAGAHGFHIHQTGKCAPDFSAAGGHFNPGDKGHGLTKDGPHAGDMPNIHAGEDGKARADVFNMRVSLEDGANSLFDEDGSAIIVHENPDSYGAEAGAGGRLACGVIRQ